METRRHRMILFRQDCHRCGRTISTSCNLRSLYPWVSKFLLQHWYRHHNHLFSSQQHRLQLRVSKPRMLSWWLRPCGRWCHPWFNSNNAWVPFQEGQELQEWDVHRQQLLQCYRLGYLGLMLHQGFFPISDDQCSYKDTIDTSYCEIYSTDWNTRMCPFAALGCSAFTAHSRSPVDHHPSVVTLDPPRRHRLQVSRRTRKKFWRETMKFFVRRCAVLWHRSIPALITLMIRIRRLDPWFPQMMCTRTKSPGSYSLLWKVLSGTVPILLREWITQMIAQRPHFVIHLHHRSPSLSSSHHIMFWEKSITDCKSTSLRTINHHRLFGTGAKDKVTQYTMSSQNVLHTEELMRRVAIYSSIIDSLVASILEHIPKEHRTKIVQEQVRILHKSSNKAVSAAVAAASNL